MKKFLFILALPVCFLKAQNAPIKITIYSGDSAKVSQVDEKPANNTNEFKNLIKWNYCLLGRGVLMFNYERHISNRFTFEMGVGATYSDFMFTTYYEIGNFTRNLSTTTNNSSGGTTTTSILSNPFENSTKRFGFAIEVSPKVYFDKDEFQGFYVSPYLSFRKYNYTYVTESYYSSNGSTPATPYDLDYTFLDIGGKAGYQYYFSFYDNLYYDFYVGVAYRSAHLNTLKMITDQGYAGNTTTYTPYLQTMGLGQVMLGAKLGLAF